MTSSIRLLIWSGCWLVIPTSLDHQLTTWKIFKEKKKTFDINNTPNDCQTCPNMDDVNLAVKWRNLVLGSLKKYKLRKWSVQSRPEPSTQHSRTLQKKTRTTIWLQGAVVYSTGNRFRVEQRGRWMSTEPGKVSQLIKFQDFCPTAPAPRYRVGG